MLTESPREPGLRLCSHDQDPGSSWEETKGEHCQELDQAVCSLLPLALDYYHHHQKILRVLPSLL